MTATHFDHDHRERENIRFLAIFPLVPDLRRGPLKVKVILKRDTPLVVQVPGDHREAKIRDARFTGIFDQDVSLVECQRDVKQDLG